MRLVALTIALIAPPALSSRADDPKPSPPAKELFVGTWKLTRTDTPQPKGTEAGLVVEKDGTLKLSLTLDGKTEVVRGKYKFDGDKTVVVTLTGPGGETKEERLGVEVTAKTLKLTDPKKQVDEFERAEEKKPEKK